MTLFSYVTKPKKITEKPSDLIVFDSDTDGPMEGPSNFLQTKRQRVRLTPVILIVIMIVVIKKNNLLHVEYLYLPDKT